MVWSHCVGRGRAIYSALGHTASSYAEPKHIQLIQGAISWAAGYEGTGCADGAKQDDPVVSGNSKIQVQEGKKPS